MKGTILFAVFAFFLAALPAAAQDVIGDETEIPRGTAETLDNFEKGNYWIWAAFDWEQWGPEKLSTSARIANSWFSEGRHSLECRFKKSAPDSDHIGTYFMDYRWNFSGSKYVVLDVHNPEKDAFLLSIIFQTTDAWNWDETTTVEIAPGSHTLVFSLANFQKDLYLVNRVNICYHEKTPMNGRFYVDNIRLIK